MWEKVNFKIYDVADWETNNYNKYIAQYFKTVIKFGLSIEVNVFHEESCTKCDEEAGPRPFYKKSN